ncbi:MAG: hypothetical protein LVQ95_05515 [Candidatus Micrarchaeales archaeon]|nr:hypothetical protein [Candidatus Micrarchaeales archaeon]
MVDGLIRLSEAVARTRLSNVVAKGDAELGVKVMGSMLRGLEMKSRSRSAT